MSPEFNIIMHTEKLSKEPSFIEIGLRSVITEFAIELASFKDERWHPSGTAVIIGPWLAISAKHVVEDHWRTHEYRIAKAEPGKHTNLTGSFPFFAYQGLKEGTEGALWTITKLWLSPHTDVAFLRLTPWSKSAANYVWRLPTLDLAPPEVGSRISGFGYHSPEVELEEIEDNFCKVNWKSSPTTTIGEVIEVYEHRRDLGMLKFPCFKVNARFKGGMSGGPIFNERGHLCGLICSSFLHPDEEGERDSYVSTLWPSMVTLIDLEFQEFKTIKLYPVLDLARDGLIKANGWEKVMLIRDELGNIQKVGWLK